jgi:hypothetical protein
MAYDTPTRISHSLGIVVLSAATTFQIRGPKGMKGRIVDIVGTVTTAITVTAPKLALGNLINSPVTGTAADADSYAEYVIPITAINLPLAATQDDPSFKSRTTNPYKGKINADQVVVLLVTTTATAGAANLTLVIEWFV